MESPSVFSTLGKGIVAKMRDDGTYTIYAEKDYKASAPIAICDGTIMTLEAYMKKATKPYAVALSDNSLVASNVPTSGMSGGVFVKEATLLQIPNAQIEVKNGSAFLYATSDIKSGNEIVVPPGSKLDVTQREKSLITNTIVLASSSPISTASTTTQISPSYVEEIGSSKTVPAEPPVKRTRQRASSLSKKSELKKKVGQQILTRRAYEESGATQLSGIELDERGRPTVKTPPKVRKPSRRKVAENPPARKAPKRRPATPGVGLSTEPSVEPFVIDLETHPESPFQYARILNVVYDKVKVLDLTSTVKLEAYLFSDEKPLDWISIYNSGNQLNANSVTVRFVIAQIIELKILDLADTAVDTSSLVAMKPVVLSIEDLDKLNDDTITNTILNTLNEYEKYVTKLLFTHLSANAHLSTLTDVTGEYIESEVNRLKNSEQSLPEVPDILTSSPSDLTAPDNQNKFRLYSIVVWLLNVLPGIMKEKGKLVKEKISKLKIPDFELPEKNTNNFIENTDSLSALLVRLSITVLTLADLQYGYIDYLNRVENIKSKTSLYEGNLKDFPAKALSQWINILESYAFVIQKMTATPLPYWLRKIETKKMFGAESDIGFQLVEGSGGVKIISRFSVSAQPLSYAEFSVSTQPVSPSSPGRSVASSIDNVKLLLNELQKVQLKNYIIEEFNFGMKELLLVGEILITKMAIDENSYVLETNPYGGQLSTYIAFRMFRLDKGAQCRIYFQNREFMDAYKKFTDLPTRNQAQKMIHVQTKELSLQSSAKEITHMIMIDFGEPYYLFKRTEDIEQYKNIVNKPKSKVKFVASCLDPFKMRKWYNFYVHQEPIHKIPLAVDSDAYTLYIYKRSELTEEKLMQADITFFGVTSKREIDASSKKAIIPTDYLDLPMRPYEDKLEKAGYEKMESETKKYELYKKAFEEAIKTFPQNAKLCVGILGAGKGGIVKEVYKAIVSLKYTSVSIVAIDINDEAIELLKERNKVLWGESVKIIHKDLVSLKLEDVGEVFDIVLSELLGSFGDNEMAPDILNSMDVNLFKDKTIWIPESYTSLIAPAYNDTLSEYITRQVRLSPGEPEELYEKMWVLKTTEKFVSDSLLAKPKPVFKFEHKGRPNPDSVKNFETRIRFEVDRLILNIKVNFHVLYGFFECTLYGNVKFDTVPNPPFKTILKEWNPVVFPLVSDSGIVKNKDTIFVQINRYKKKGVDIFEGKEEEVDLVWYSWRTAVIPTTPTGYDKIITIEHNSDGSSQHFIAKVYPKSEESVVPSTPPSTKSPSSGSGSPDVTSEPDSESATKTPERIDLNEGVSKGFSIDVCHYGGDHAGLIANKKFSMGKNVIQVPGNVVYIDDATKPDVNQYIKLNTTHFLHVNTGILSDFSLSSIAEKPSDANVRLVVKNLQVWGIALRDINIGEEIIIDTAKRITSTFTEFNTAALPTPESSPASKTGESEAVTAPATVSIASAPAQDVIPAPVVVHTEPAKQAEPPAKQAEPIPEEPKKQAEAPVKQSEPVPEEPKKQADTPSKHKPPEKEIPPPPEKKSTEPPPTKESEIPSKSTISPPIVNKLPSTKSTTESPATPLTSTKSGIRRILGKATSIFGFGSNIRLTGSPKSADHTEGTEVESDTTEVMQKETQPPKIIPPPPSHPPPPTPGTPKPPPDVPKPPPPPPSDEPIPPPSTTGGGGGKEEEPLKPPFETYQLDYLFQCLRDFIDKGENPKVFPPLAAEKIDYTDLDKYRLYYKERHVIKKVDGLLVYYPSIRQYEYITLFLNKIFDSFITLANSRSFFQKEGADKKIKLIEDAKKSIAQDSEYIKQVVYQINAFNVNDIIAEISQYKDSIAPKLCRLVISMIDLIVDNLEQRYWPQSLIKYMIWKRSKYFRKFDFSVALAKKENQYSSCEASMKMKFSINVREYDVPVDRSYPEQDHEFEVYLPMTVTPFGHSDFFRGNKFQHEIDIECHERLDPVASIIGIRLYKLVYPVGDDGKRYSYTRREPIADGVISLFDIMSKKRVFSLNLKDMSYPKKDYIKINLDFSVSHFELSGAEFSDVSIIPDDIELISIAKIQDFFSFYQTGNVKPVDTRLNKIHVPRYPTNTIEIPASFYAAETPAMVNGTLVRRLLQCSLILNNMKEDTFISIATKQFDTVDEILIPGFKNCIKVVCDALTLFPNLCDYKPDRSNGVICERFLSPFKTLMDDCEGDAAAIMSFANYLFYHNTYGELYEVDRLTANASFIVQLFLPVMVTGAVTNPNFKANIKAKQNNSYMCHTYAMLHPRKYVTQTYQVPTRFTKKLFENNPEKKWENLIQEIWTLEGTNFVNGFMLPNRMMHDHEEIKKYVLENDKYLTNKTRDVCKKYPAFSYLPMQAFQIEYQCSIDDFRQSKVEISSFYKHVVSIWTNVFADMGFYVTDFTACIEDGNSLKYGPRYNDFITKNSKIKIVPTFEMTRDEWVYFMNIIREQPPFEMEAGSNEEKKIRELDLISERYPVKKRENKLQFGIDWSEEIVDSTTPPYLSFRLNHPSKVDKDLLKHINDILSDRSIGFVGFSYIYLPILKNTPDFCLIELRFHK